MPIQIAFWAAVAIMAYVYFGYPALVRLLATLLGRQRQVAEVTPLVSLVIAAYNEEKSIADKLQNTLALDYPRDKLEITVASNGCTDKTNQIVTAYSAFGVRLNSIAEPGKTNAQNRTVPMTRGEIIVFSDANSICVKNAIAKLVRNFADPRVGLVQGRAVPRQRETSLTTSAVHLYLKYEDMIKTAESRLGASVAAYGGLLAIRRELFQPIDINLMEDFVLPITAIARGYRAVFEPEAMFYENAAGGPRDEFMTRARIITQDSRAFFALLPGLLKSGKVQLIFQLVSHKLLRWLVPFFMGIALATNLMLYNTAFYPWLLWGQVAFYLAAIASHILPRRFRPKPLLVPYYFCLVNGAALVGIVRMLVGERRPTWEKAESTR